MNGYKLWQLILYPTAQILIGFALSRRYGWAWDTVVVLLSLCLMATFTSIYILLSEVEQVLRSQAYDNQINPPRQPVTVNVPDLNPKFGLTLRPVQIDVERAFARVLMEFPNDMTEKTWIKRGRWQQLGGTSREQFKCILDKWEAAGIVSKRNPNVINSPYFVSRKAGLAQIAGGRSPIYYPSPAQSGDFKAGAK
jgi:hypothetical protein